MLKSLINFGIGLCAGGIVGWLFIREKYEREYNNIVNDIYNNAYKEAKEEIQKKMNAESNTYKHIVKTYDKPDLSEVLHEKLTENFINENKESDEEIIDGDYALTPDSEWDVGESGIITEHDYYNSCQHYNKEYLYFYLKDEILADDDDEVFFDEYIERVKNDYLPILKKDKKVFLRNAEIETDFSINSINSYFSEIQAETPKERFKRLNKTSKTPQDEI